MFNKFIHRWFVDVIPDVARSRLVERHLHASIESNTATAKQRVEGNDMRNAELVISKLIRPNVIITS